MSAPRMCPDCNTPSVVHEGTRRRYEIHRCRACGTTQRIMTPFETVLSVLVLVFGLVAPPFIGQSAAYQRPVYWLVIAAWGLFTGYTIVKRVRFARRHPKA